jgi:iron(III) transport system permease protein
VALADASETPLARSAPTRVHGWSATSLLAWIATLICATPALAVLLLALRGGDSAIGWDLVRDGAAGTLTLVLFGGGAAIVLGSAAAWLVSLCRFPGRDVFAWALVLPLAAPSFVLAYAYASMTWSNGSLFEVSGFWGAAFIYAIGLYPYVYLSARAAFTSQTSCALEAARSLGATSWQVFTRVALPLARPGIVAGGALAIMEIAADYGAAQHFGLTTLSTAIFRAWYAHGAPQAALQIATLLLAAAVVFLVIERRARGRAAFSGGSTRWRPLPRYTLHSIARWSAAVFCTALVMFGAGLPLAWLVRLAWLHADASDLISPLLNSLLLASSGAAIALTLAAIIAAIARTRGAAGKAALFASGMGYAAPGAVIALGALSVFGLAREAGLVGGFGSALALAALIWVYAARFTAAGVQPIDAGLARLYKGVDASARVLGASPWRRIIRVDLPIAAPSLAAAALILFVEILKELPATLILRPFNFDTLAVKAYAYASDERLLEAAAPSLMIFAAGLLPIMLLSRQITRARAGAR